MLDLSASQIEEIRAIFAQDFPDLEVFAFGSRVKGKAKPYSDLDLALRGSEALSIARFGRIVEAFQDWNRCSSAFRDLVAAQSVQILP